MENTPIFAEDKTPQQKAFQLSWKILGSMILPPFPSFNDNIEYSIKAREKARKKAIYFFDEVFKGY
ncbi:MAG: hypothetical protein Q9M94_03215 [Candidatus Gracilibacteria bacterium]|nr:hypothetical protein [Candidatus Gracilibacteria bacterium]MDQ7022368.1 hypothetical protein [Candidatus Gracilibacteria bacterium]